MSFKLQHIASSRWISRSVSRVSLAVMALLALSLEGYTATTRVMPLGDAITGSLLGQASYRYWLWKKIVAAGWDIDFVGGEKDVHGGKHKYSDFDNDHEGHWAFSTEQVLSGLDTWGPLNKADFVLLHIGSVDILQNKVKTDIALHTGQIIDKLRAQNPQVKIILAQIVPGGDATRNTHIVEFNALLPALVAQKQNANSPLTLVDQYTGYDGTVDNVDGIHPQESGEKKLSAKWFEAMKPYFEATSTQSQIRPLMATSHLPPKKLSLEYLANGKITFAFMNQPHGKMLFH